MQGPIFGNILLADEINRTPPKTQTALLEAMQERVLHGARQHYTLPSPFFVLATQNPIELEGTYPLPEAQLDRFLFNTVLDYLIGGRRAEGGGPDHDDARSPQADPVTNAEEILDFQQLVRMVPIGDSASPRYAVDLVRATRATRRNRARLRQEVRQLRRQRARGAVPGAGGQGARADEGPLSRDLRGRPGAVHPDPAAPHSAELPRGDRDRLKQDDILKKMLEGKPAPRD